MAQKPQKTQFLDSPKSIGDHIRKRRLQLRWGATQLGHALKVSADTVYNWEKNRTNPEIRFIPRIVEFLGYDPTNSAATSFGERIKKYRVEHGLSQKMLALQLRIDSLTVRKLENNRGKPTKRIVRKMLEMLDIKLERENHS